ncbi:MAG: replication-relaxation family protein [Rhizomicrobium sp.]|jgi:hypothetical protein
MHRVRTGKRIALTPRDIEIFRALSRYRYLRSTYLHAFAGGRSATRFKERLGDLFHEGYLDRPSQQWQFADALHAPVIYELGEGAKHTLQERGGIEDAWTVLSQAAHRQFTHSVMICACLASIDLATKRKDSLRFIAWPEILARAPEATRMSPMAFRIPTSSLPVAVVPDGMFGLEYSRDDKKTYRFFALEADRGTMPVTRSNSQQTSYLGKLGAYQEVIARQAHKNYLGIPNLFVLTVTTDQSRLFAIMRRFADRGTNSTFLFKAADPATLGGPVPDLLMTPWERHGLPPLRIGE